MRKKLFIEKRSFFPPPQLGGPEGLVAVDNNLSVERLLEAYSFGIFPWPEPDYPVLWFCPEQRGILEFSDFKIPKRLSRELKKVNFTCTWDKNFPEVIKQCRLASRPGQGGTWITEEMESAYVDFFKAGYAHSLEIWQNGRLAGGLYGVYVGGVFSAESMFFKVSPASKVALIQCVLFLMEEGQTWMDIQMVTALSKSFGAKYIPRMDYLRKLNASKKSAKPIDFTFFES